MQGELDEIAAELAAALRAEEESAAAQVRALESRQACEWAEHEAEDGGWGVSDQAPEGRMVNDRAASTYSSLLVKL